MQHIGRFYQSGDQVVRALDDVSLDIYPGEFVAIMGQSGSGKSTLMNIIGCLDRASSGRYEIYGQDVSQFDSDALATLRRETFGFVFQRYNLLATSTARQNVEIPAVYAGMNKADRQQRAQKLLEKLGMGERSHHRPSQLSGGQQQRVAIARALMNDPPVILADEPTGALDTRSGQDVMALLKQQHENGRTVILITHDEQVASHAHRIIRVQDGRVIEDVQVVEERVKPAATKDMEGSGTVRLTATAMEAVKIAVNALRVNIFRTALTLLGIVIGVAAVITMLAIGNGSKQQVLEQISSLGTNIISIRPGAPGIRSSGDIATMTMDDAKALEAIDNIEAVVADRAIQKTLRYGNMDYATGIQGVGASFPIVRDWPVASGNFFTTKDLESYSPVIVLGSAVKAILFPDSDPIGEYVLVGTIPFEVIGVMDSKGAAPWGGDQDDTAFIPITTGLIRLFGTTFIGGITVKVTDSDKITATEEAIKSIILSRHGTEDFQVRNTSSFLEMATATQNTLTILLGAVAAISLLVGGIGVMNIMLVSVTERTREIGIRMATGARERDIMIQFNTEAAVVCTIGGIVGVIIGFIAGWGVSLLGANVLFTVGPALMAFSCAVMTGILFGYLPARKAAQMDPVVALSSE